MASRNKLNFSEVYHEQFPHHRFVIMEQPKPLTTPEVLTELTARSVTSVVRVCFENEYDYTDVFEEKGFECYAFPYKDGSQPSDDVIKKWTDLCEQNAQKNKKEKPVRGEEHAIAIHCVAGLGRAPLLVALMYIEAGMEGLDAAGYLREKRQGCINAQQLDYLRTRKTSKGSGCGCNVM